MTCGWHDGKSKHSVKLYPEYKDTTLFTKLDENLVKYVFGSGELHFSHNCSIEENTFETHPNLKGKFVVGGKAYSSRFKRYFIAMVEYKDYPIYLN